MVHERRAQLAGTLVSAVLLVSACANTPQTPPSGASVTQAPMRTPTPSPAPTSAPPPDVISGQIEVGGLVRSYLAAIPPDIESMESVPMLLVLHGYTQGPRDAERISGFDSLARDQAAIVIYPAGYHKEGFENSWNGGGCCEPATTDNVDDVEFLVALVDELSTEFPVDPDRVFIVGGSNGGEMAYRAACERPDVFASVAVVSGALLVDCTPARSVSVIDIHGSDDSDIPYPGGQGCQHMLCPSVPDTMDEWRRIDGCTTGPMVTTGAHTVETTWLTCHDGSTVTFIKAIGKPHGWYSDDPDCAAVTWAFLLAHPRTSAPV